MMILEKTKYLFSVVLIVATALCSKAQIKNVSIRVDGLTCSACSYATQKSLLELAFVDSVKMDLANNIANVTFKNEAKINISQIAQKVVDAGFSVGKLTSSFNFDAAVKNENYCFEYDGSLYYIINTQEPEVKGERTVLFVGKKYMNKAELKKWKGIKQDIPCKPNEEFSGQIYTIALQ